MSLNKTDVKCVVCFLQRYCWAHRRVHYGRSSLSSWTTHDNQWQTNPRISDLQSVIRGMQKCISLQSPGVRLWTLLCWMKRTCQLIPKQLICKLEVDWNGLQVLPAKFLHPFYQVLKANNIFAALHTDWSFWTTQSITNQKCSAIQVTEVQPMDVSHGTNDDQQLVSVVIVRLTTATWYTAIC